MCPKHKTHYLDRSYHYYHEKWAQGSLRDVGKLMTGPEGASNLVTGVCRSINKEKEVLYHGHRKEKP